MKDSRKQSLYFPDAMIGEIEAEARRLDRSLSWIVQQAWIRSRAQIHLIPSQFPEGADDGLPR